VHIGGHPRDAVAVGGRLVVADYDGRILELRGPGTVRVVGRSEGTPVSLAAAGDAVWVVSVDGGRGGPPRSQLIKLDTRNGRVLARVQVQGVGDAVAAGAVGVSLPTFVRIGPALAQDPTRLTSPASEELVVGERSVWMRMGDFVLELDAAGRVVNQVGGISPTLASIGSERSVLPDGDGAWVAGQAGGVLYRIENGRVTRRVKVGGRTAGVLARKGSTVWVSATSSAGRFQLVGVDAGTGKVTGRVRLGRKAPQAIVPVGKRLWVITSGGDAIVVNPA
jgi:DNA-binding beta-propeller fold protein YncE